MIRIKTLWFVLISFGFLAACQEDEELITPNSFVQFSSATGEFNKFDPVSSKYTFTVTINPPQELQIEYVRIMKRLNGGEAIEHARLSQFPAEVQLNLTETAAGLSSVENLSKGDIFRIHFDTKAVEQTYSYRVNSFLDLPVVCPADLSGTYLTESSGKAGPGGGGAFMNIFSEVSIIKKTNSTYEVSDISGGMFANVWGGDPQAAEITESCRELMVVEFEDQWGDMFKGSGTLDEDGSLEINWTTGYGDEGTTIYRKK